MFRLKNKKHEYNKGKIETLDLLQWYWKFLFLFEDRKKSCKIVEDLVIVFDKR